MRESTHYKYKLAQDSDNSGAVLDAYGDNFIDADNKFYEILMGGGGVYGNAGYHNSVYRGKQLAPTGQGPTVAQYNAINDGTFEDLFIGDYWTINGVNWRIAAFDYYLRCGKASELTAHHALIVPDTSLYKQRMNSSNTTADGYVGSEMYQSGLNSAISTIKAAFPNRVLKHNVVLTNVVTNGRPMGWVYADREVDLMNENMVYGSIIFSVTGDGVTESKHYRFAKSQLPLFVYRPDLIAIRETYWLRDILTEKIFVNVYADGAAAHAPANNVSGVRPYFLIGGAAA